MATDKEKRKGVARQMRERARNLFTLSRRSRVSPINHSYSSVVKTMSSGEIWRSHVDLHHEPSPSQGEMQNSYTLRAGRNAERGIRNGGIKTAPDVVACVPRSAFPVPRLEKLAAPDGFAPPTSGVRDRRSAFELQGDGVRGRTRTG